MLMPSNTRPARVGRCVSVEVPPELREALKAAAAERGQTLAELVRRALAAAVKAPSRDPLARLAVIEARLKEQEARIRRAEASLR